ncbi:hypothetical protein EVAR_97229_1 [Eumeta japonica]|uniref:Uncharacterized protein n=1 Tax=Eumeta variegata TaxID=151549 RepID=A0A4C2A8H8_EUMVA|nr:hypothetical protein EVAR_97229_1 [Eumeta japonica]
MFNYPTTASRNFDDIFEEAIEQALDEMEQSSRPLSPIDRYLQFLASSLTFLIMSNLQRVDPTSRTLQTLARPDPVRNQIVGGKTQVENSLSQYSGNTEVVEEFLPTATHRPISF